MFENNITLEDKYFTDQEKFLQGATPVHKPGSFEFYIPKIISNDSIEIRKHFISYISYIRARQKYYLTPFVSALLGINDSMVLSLENLDPENGLTIKDPQVIGFYNYKSQCIYQITGRNFTRELVEVFLDNNANPFYRNLP